MNTEDSDEARLKKIYKVTIIGSIGNFLLLVFKFAAGILGRSSAMIADAVHSLSDFITDIIVVVFVRISSKPSDADHKYGHGKYETLATAIISLMLFGAGIAILWKGCSEIWRFLQGEELEQPGMIALIAALVSIVVKEALYRYTMRVAKTLNSKAVEANAWHHRSDAMSSLGTTVGIAGAIFLGVKGRVLDPIAAVVVSFFIIRVAYQLLKPCLDELVERSLPQDKIDEIISVIKSVPGAMDPHNIRTRAIGNAAAIDVHVRMDAEMTVAKSHEITREIERKLREQLGANTYINIHVEPIKNN